MAPQNPVAAKTAASISLRNFDSEPETEAIANAPDVQALSREVPQNNTQVEDVEMFKVDSMCSREVPTPKCESVVVAGSPWYPFTELTRLHTTATDVATTRAEQEQDKPQPTLTDLQTMQKPQKESNDVKKALWALSINRKESKEVDIPAYEGIDPRLAFDCVKVHAERSRHLEHQVEKWRHRAETAEQETKSIRKQLDSVEDCQKKLHDTLLRRNQQIHHLTLRLNHLEPLCERLKSFNQALSHDHDSLLQQRDELIQQSNNLEAHCNEQQQQDIHKLEETCRSLERDKQAMQERIKTYIESSEKVTLENKELCEHITQQELGVTKAQNAAMTMLSHSLSAALPDNHIRSRFSELFESIAEWARDNAAAQDQANLGHPDNISKWQKHSLLRRVDAAGSRSNLDFDLQGDTAVETLLNAALARQLCQDFLKDPFWFVKKLSLNSNTSLLQEQRFDMTVSIEHMLEKMLKYHEGDEAKIHSWRASTIQVLAGSDQGRKDISASYKRYVEDEIFPRYGQLIRSPLPQYNGDELVSIIGSFGNFAIELWSEKMVVRCYCLESFADRVYIQGHADMELARAVGVEEGDTKLDGRPIPVVLQPLVMGYGTHDGKNYDKSKVWSKGVVWVSKDDEPAIMPAIGAGKKKSLLDLFRKS